MGEQDEMIAKVLKQIEEQLRRFGEIGEQLENDKENRSQPTFERPVKQSYELIVNANRRFLASDSEGCRNDLIQSAMVAQSGVVNPDRREFTSKVLAQAHGSLWRGISAGLLGLVERDMSRSDFVNCDVWFGLSAFYFLSAGDRINCARAMAEWAEARQSIGDRESADWFARWAGTLYSSVDDDQSAVAVMHRLIHFDKPTQDSVVLLGRQPSREESLMLVTVLGGSNAIKMRSAMISYRL